MTDAIADAEALGQLVEDYARTSVPKREAISAWRIAMIMIGMTIALPAFIMGSKLGSGLGFGRMIIVCFTGGAILTLISVLSAIAGARARVSTYLLIVAAFGETGGKLANAAIGLSLLGWFGVIMMMFGRSAAEIVGAAGSGRAVTLWASGGAILMVSSAIVGFKALDRLSSILTPAKAILLLTGAGAALYQYGTGALHAVPATPMPLGTGITLVVGSLVIGAAVQPDVTRYARSPLDAALASGLVHLVAFPVVLLLAGLPSIVTHEPDLVAVMVMLGLGIPAIATVILAAWTNNTYNLYASSLVLSTIMVRQPRWRLTLVVGTIGTALGLLGISDQLIPYLVLLSVLMPPIAGVYLANYYLYPAMPIGLDKAASWSWRAGLSWIIGAGFAGAGTYFGFSLAGIPALDSLILSAACYVALDWLRRR